jgi:hypothetical protein
MAPLFFI